VRTPYARVQWPWAIIEICSDDAPEDTRLIVAGYRASRSGVVGLALRGVTAASVDRVLDAIVDPRDASLHGVVYLDGNDRQAVGPAVAHAGVVIAASDDFRHQIAELGVAALDPDQGRILLALTGASRAAGASIARASA
jgi:hypothetical protein